MTLPSAVDFSTVKRVLSVHHLLAMGDAVLLSVAFEVLKRNCPWLSLSVLTRQYASPFLEAIPGIDDIILLERFGVPARNASSTVALVYSRVSAILQLALFMRRGRYDCIFLRNDRRVPYTRMLHAAAKLSGAQHIIILEPLLRKHVLASRHIVQTYLEILQELGLQVTGKERPRLILSKEGQKFARTFLEQHGLSKAKDKIVGLCPISNVKVKNWSPEHVAILGNSLTTDESIKLILFSSDAEHTDRVVKSMARPPIIVGHLPFDHFLGLVAHCDLFIGVDTGPTHVAAALGVPTIGIFGPTSSIIAAPYGEKSVVLQAEKDCPYYRPLGLFHPGETFPVCYGQDRCQIVERIGSQTCTNLVPAAEVFAVAKGLLQEGD